MTVTGIRSDKGTLRLALFDNAREFPQGQELLSQNVRAAKGNVTVVFEDLAAGDYAIALHHDENDNGRMDSGLLGIPQEGYGFSNNPLVLLGAPPFSDAAVELTERDREITIEVDY